MSAPDIHSALKALVEYWDWGGYDAMRETRLKEICRGALAEDNQFRDATKMAGDAAKWREVPFRYTAKLIGIVHKMRGAFEKILAIEGYGAPWIEAKTIAQKALEIALPDRRYAQNPESLSNTAKMREALEEIVDAINEARTEGRIEHWEYSNLFDIADAALAAPPRNCDKFMTADEAREAWWQEEVLPRVHGQKAGVELAYHKWLFAPAEQEGCRQ